MPRRQNEGQEPTGRVHAVLGLLPHSASVAVNNGIRHFLAAMSGQTVQEHGIGASMAEEPIVDLIAGESVEALGPFSFLAHGGPYIGVDHIGASYGLEGVLGNQRFATSVANSIEIAGPEALTGRMSDPHFHARQMSADGQ